VRLGPLVIETMRSMVLDSGVMECDDSGWPAADAVGRQELEVVAGAAHCEMEGRGEAAEGLKTFYFFVQDLRCLVLALIALHFKLKPI
jgi:protein mago nashi